MIPLTPRPGRVPIKLLCLGAHSDDIEIGCGGTVLKFIQDHQGEVAVCWVVLSSSTKRKAEATRSADSFLRQARKKDVRFGTFEDSFFPYHGSDIKKYLHQLSREFTPDIIFTHSGKDLHQDHRIVSELTWNAFRDHLILEYEIPKYDGDIGAPNVFVPLDEAICRIKVEYLLRHFESQRTRPWFTEDTFRSLQRLRGIECNSLSGYAEAFYSRKIVL